MWYTFKHVFVIGNIVLVISIINMSHNSNLLLSNGNFCKWRLNHFDKVLKYHEPKELN